MGRLSRKHCATAVALWRARLMLASVAGGPEAYRIKAKPASVSLDCVSTQRLRLPMLQMPAFSRSSLRHKERILHVQKASTISQVDALQQYRWRTS
jgi:hypothetical protein